MYCGNQANGVVFRRDVTKVLRNGSRRVEGHEHDGKAGTLWYYRTITDIVLKQGPDHLAAELDRVVTEIERLAGQKA